MSSSTISDNLNNDIDVYNQAVKQSENDYAQLGQQTTVIGLLSAMMKYLGDQMSIVAAEGNVCTDAQSYATDFGNKYSDMQSQWQKYFDVYTENGGDTNNPDVQQAYNDYMTAASADAQGMQDDINSLQAFCQDPDVMAMFDPDTLNDISGACSSITDAFGTDAWNDPTGQKMAEDMNGWMSDAYIGVYSNTNINGTNCDVYTPTQDPEFKQIEDALDTINNSFTALNQVLDYTLQEDSSLYDAGQGGLQSWMGDLGSMEGNSVSAQTRQ